LLDTFRVKIPLGEVAFTAEETEKIASTMPGGCVVKSQILGGGRGMGHILETGYQGGVKVVDTPQQAKEVATNLLGNRLVTIQSGAEGLPVNCVYVVAKIAIDKEFYLSLTLDRAAGMPCFIYSPEGGMAIEQVAHDTPEKIFKYHVNPFEGPDVDKLAEAAVNLGIPEHKSQVTFLMKAVYDAFMEKDCDLIEINPLITTKDGTVMAADSKVTVDSNAAFRQKDLAEAEDKTQMNEREMLAQNYDLNYIHIGGNIGCLVNGAGLAMSTMDIIKLYGGEPANFLDVGGSADEEQMTEAFKLLNSDDEVKAIFINIFGGILRCDKLMESILSASKTVGLTKPIVLRLKGTNSDIAKKMLEGKEKDLGIFYEEDFDTAAQEVCKIVK
jgi:succinyl-CoA synthetase beta subunit